MTLAVGGGDLGVPHGDPLGGPGGARSETRHVTFARLYEQYRKPLYSFCVARTRDADLAEDVVQNAFFKAFTTYERYDPTRAFWPWLASIAARECVNAHRRELRVASRAGRAAGETVWSPVDPTAATVLEQLEHAPLWEQLARIPARQRAALQLFAVDGWSYAEIAAQLGDSMSAVKTLIARARARLRESIGGALLGLGNGVRSLRHRLGRRSVRLQSACIGWTEQLVSGASSVVCNGPLLSALLVGIAAVLQPSTSPPPSETVRPTIPADLAVAADSTPAAARPSSGAGEEPRTAWRDATPALPSGAVERTVNQAVAPVLWPVDDTGTDETHVSTIAVSPSYEDDHTVFLSGWSLATVSSRSPLLFVSRDGGASWVRLPAQGFGGARRLFLPPSFPEDGRIFALGDKGLQVSGNGGESFETPVPGLFGDAALSPAFDTGHPAVLLVGGGKVFEYRVDRNALDLLELDGQWSADVVHYARYLPVAGPDPAVILSSTRWVPAGTRTTTTYQSARCWKQAASAPNLHESLRCEQATVEERVFILQFETTTSGAADIVYGRSIEYLHVSADGGRSFVRHGPRKAWPFLGTVNDVAVATGPDGVHVVLAVAPFDTGPAVLLSTDGGGQRWTPLKVDRPGFEYGAAEVAVTPTGRIIAGGTTGRVACSADGGRTWGTTCPAPEVD